MTLVIPSRRGNILDITTRTVADNLRPVESARASIVPVVEEKVALL